LPRDEKAIAARRGANRTPAAKAEKSRDEALVRQLRARVEQLEQIELARVRNGGNANVVAQEAVAAPAAPAAAIVPAEVAHQNPAPGAAVGVPPAVMVDGAFQHQASSVDVPLGSHIELLLTDAKIMNKWETFWWVCNWFVRIVSVLGFCGLWSILLALCWWYHPFGQADYTMYQLIGSAYPKASETDRRHVTFKTCPIDSPNYEPDANYMTYWLIKLRGGVYSRKRVTISHTLWREAGAPKNESRYTTVDSLKTAYADTVSFLRTHGHVNLNKDLQAAQHVINHTAAFYVFKLKVDLFLDEVQTNVICQ
jgi:hypothetical protein